MVSLTPSSVNTTQKFENLNTDKNNGQQSRDNPENPRHDPKSSSGNEAGGLTITNAPAALSSTPTSYQSFEDAHQPVRSGLAGATNRNLALSQTPVPMTALTAKGEITGAQSTTAPTNRSASGVQQAQQQEKAPATPGGAVQLAKSERAQDAIIYQMTPRSITSRVDAFRTALSVLDVSIADLKNEEFNAAGGSTSELAANTASEINEGFNKVGEIFNRFSVATQVLRGSSKAVLDYYGNLPSGLQRERLQQVFRHSLRDLYPQQNGETNRILDNLDQNAATAIDKVSRFITKSNDAISTLYQTEQRMRIFNTLTFVLGGLGAVAGGLGVINSFKGIFDKVRNFDPKDPKFIDAGDLLGVFGTSLGTAGAGGLTINTGFNLPAFASQTFPDATNPNLALREQMQKSQAGKAALNLAENQYGFQRELLRLSPGKFGDLVGDKVLDFTYSTRSTTTGDLAAQARERIRVFEARGGSDTTFAERTSGPSAFSQKRYEAWNTVHPFPMRTKQDIANEFDALRKTQNEFLEKARKSFATEPAFPPGGGGSDRRIKTDVRVIARHRELNVNLYSWRYKNQDRTRYVGVMAQDILLRPDLAHSVFEARYGEFAGYLAVDYAAIGLSMNTETEWQRLGFAALNA